MTHPTSGGCRAFAAAIALAFVALVTLHPRRADAQTIGPVALALGGGLGAQPEADFSLIGFHFWGGAEAVLDRQIRIRLDASAHHFFYDAPAPAPCPPTRYCAPPITTDLDVFVVSAAVVWRDTTGANPFYALAGLATYAALQGRDGNSRIGLTGGIGWTAPRTPRLFVEARVHLPYDAFGYGVFVPVTVGFTL